MAAVATPTFATTRTRILIASADAAFRKRLKNDPLYAESDSEEAVGGAHALSKLAQYPCDSVLLDRNLPDLDAWEVAEQIRKRFPRTEVELVDADFAGLDPHESKAQDQDERLAGNGETKAAATTTALIRPAGSARRFRNHCWRRSCLGTRAGRLRAQCSRGWAAFTWRKAVRCFWTKLASCR